MAKKISKVKKIGMHNLQKRLLNIKKSIKNVDTHKNKKLLW